MPKNVQTTVQLCSFYILAKWSEVAQSCPTLCDPMDCSLPSSSTHGIFQARILEWVAISFSRWPSRPRDWTQISHIVDRCFIVWATREVHMLARLCSKSFSPGSSRIWTKNSEMYKLVFKEAEEPETKLPTFIGLWRKQESSQKTSASASLTMLKPLTMRITTNCGKRDGSTRPPYLSPEKPVCWSRSNS